MSPVRDRNVAEVHVLVTEHRTGAGGQKVTLDPLGRRPLEGTERQVQYAAGPTETDAETRLSLVRRLEMGLMPYVAHTSAAARPPLRSSDGVLLSRWRGRP